MSQADGAVPQGDPPSVGAARAERNGAYDAGLAPVFTVTAFLSALLLFALQPMFAKMVLPVLGGSPSVWAVALCFFQAALLAGYCYAHLLIAWLPVRWTGLVHLAVSAAAALALPVALPAAWGEPPVGEPYVWQIGLFAVAIGAPFVAVAANAPLLQSWFAASGHRDARDPYFLYAASNLGSLVALLAYPFVLEPWLGLSVLSRAWTIGYAVLVLSVAAAFAMVARRAVPPQPPLSTPAGVPDAAPPDLAPTWSRRAGWVGLAFVPSALLTAFTTHVATDVASAPLLWVLPLSLYLLTFVLVFRPWPMAIKPALLQAHLATIVAALLVLSQTRLESWFLASAAGVAAFFTSALVAHRQLYDTRPAAAHLTEFYLLMALGGALGGLAAGLLAPKVFSEVFEYPLLIALSAACRPGALRPRTDWSREILVVWLIVAGGVLAVYWIPWAVSAGYLPSGDWGATPLVAALLASVAVLAIRHPTRQLAAVLMMVLAVVWLPSSVRRGDATRSFFGVYRVMTSDDGNYNILIHGTTLHGAQRIRDADGHPVSDISPATYYHSGSPMAQSVVITREQLDAAGRKGRYGVVGLGTGSLGCHAAEGEHWRFFEIDPAVIAIASNPQQFSFLSNCQPNPDIVIGDARLMLAKEADKSFDLIIVDAFSSDAIPVHLMTAEALKLYMAKLTDNGVALLHISNRYLDLEAVLEATTPVVPGLHGIIVSDDVSDGGYAATTSTVALFAKSEAALEPFRAMDGLIELRPPRLRPWTDDASDILGPFLARLRN